MYGWTGARPERASCETHLFEEKWKTKNTNGVEGEGDLYIYTHIEDRNVAVYFSSICIYIYICAEFGGGQGRATVIYTHT